MNKIYKVVWNKARNCYIVGSEFVKSQGKACSAKKILAVLVAAGSIGGTMSDVQAANITDTKTVPQMVCYEQTWDTDVQKGTLGTSITAYQKQGNNLQLNFLKFKKYKTQKDEDALAIRLGANVDGANTSGNLYFVDTNTKNTTLSTVIDNKGIIKSILTDSDDKTVASTVDISKYVQGEVNKKSDYHLIANTAKDSKGVYKVDNNGNVELFVADDTNKKTNTVKISNVASKDSVAVVYDNNKSLKSTNAGTVGSESIALGKDATTGWMSVALGDKTKATGQDSTAIGHEAEATGLDSIAIGGKAKATGSDSIAIGNDTTASSIYSVAIGDDIHFTGNSATAVGQQAHATGDYSTALGAMTNVDAKYNASHSDWRKSGTQSTTIGYGSGSWGDYSTALGAFAKTENQFSSAIGYNSQATAENAVALGAAAKASAHGGVALGTLSVADRAAGEKGAFAPDQINATEQSTWVSTDGAVSVGDIGQNITRQITNVAAGSKDTDAVNVAQLKKVSKNITNIDNQLVNLNGRISNLDNRVNKVGAGAAALAALHPLDFDPDAKWDFAAGYGNYRGTNAAAVGAYYRPNEDTMFSVGGTFGNGENMVNAGVSFKLGSGSSHVSTSRVAMAKEIKELRGELEAMKSAMLDANAGKKIDTSKLQLFPDVPQNHWAYEYVTQLAGNGMIEGYPDGNFAGDRPMTRYEFAAILYRAMTKGAVLSDKILSEFSHELEYFTVDTVAKDKAGNPTIQRVRTVKANTNK